MSSENAPPPAWFGRARAGDPAAHAELTRIVRGLARTICRGGGPAGAREIDWEDVAQESLRKLFATGLERYRGTGSETSYLFTLVKCTVIEMSRSARRRQRRHELSLTGDATTHPNPGAGIDVEWILGRLSGECRELIERAFLHGQSYSSLAHEMGMAESSVRAKLSRCIRRARELSSGGTE
jgi:DNA-directed RNA polymerase specialized sigma24 family protein